MVQGKNPAADKHAQDTEELGWVRYTNLEIKLLQIEKQEL